MKAVIKSLSIFFKYASYPFSFLSSVMQLIGLLAAIPFAAISDIFDKIHETLEYQIIIRTRSE